MARFGVNRVNMNLMTLPWRNFARMTMVDLYRVLGVRRNASREEIDRKFAWISEHFDSERVGENETLRKKAA